MPRKRQFPVIPKSLSLRVLLFMVIGVTWILSVSAPVHCAPLVLPTGLTLNNSSKTYPG